MLLKKIYEWYSNFRKKLKSGQVFVSASCLIFENVKHAVRTECSRKMLRHIQTRSPAQLAIMSSIEIRSESRHAGTARPFYHKSMV